MTEPPFYPTAPEQARLAMPATAPPLLPTVSALVAMTDLTTEAAHVVAPERHIDDALHDMIMFGVRLLFVVQEGAVLGIVTSYDISGERPMQVLQPGDRPHRHADITVADVMTPTGELKPLRFSWVARATAADVAALFRTRPETHLLVAEREMAGAVLIRGIFSRTRLERQLTGD